MDAPNIPSFSLGRKFRIGAQVVLLVLFVAVVVVMANYLAARHFLRLQLSQATSTELSPQTLSLVRSITNDVNVTLFYNTDDDLYTKVLALAQEYRLNNPKISVRTVDYLRNAAEAERVKVEYNLSSSLITGKEKNWIIFACNGHTNVFPGNGLAAYTYEEERGATNDIEYARKLVGFKGEVVFTSILFAITNPKPLTAYFLQGHGEADPLEQKNEMGYNKFASVIYQNYIIPHFLSLTGTNVIPPECNLIIIAGPKEAFSQDELAKISQYLTEGGRLFALFNVYSLNHPTGLEKVLAAWGVNVGNFVVRDPDNTQSSGVDVLVSQFSKHPVVNSLIGSQMQLIYPRAISAIDPNMQIADAPKVEEIAFTGPHAFEVNNPAGKPGRLPLMVAVEKSAPSGVVTDRGSTRILVVGDSLFLDNQVIESSVHRDFASYAVNWLLDRSILLQGLGPKPVTEYRVMLTTRQMVNLKWVLLGAIPGGLLFLGGLVWLRRRK